MEVSKKNAPSPFMLNKYFSCIAFAQYMSN